MKIKDYLDYLIEEFDDIENIIDGVGDLNKFENRIKFLYDLIIEENRKYKTGNFFYNVGSNELSFLIYNIYDILGDDCCKKIIRIILESENLSFGHNYFIKSVVTMFNRCIYLNFYEKAKIFSYIIEEMKDKDVGTLTIIQQGLLDDEGISECELNKIFNNNEKHRVLYSSIFKFIIFWALLDDEVSELLKNNNNNYDKVIDILERYFSNSPKGLFRIYLETIDSNSREIIINFMKNEKRLEKYYRLYFGGN